MNGKVVAAVVVLLLVGAGAAYWSFLREDDAPKRRATPTPTAPTASSAAFVLRVTNVGEGDLPVDVNITAEDGTRLMKWSFSLGRGESEQQSLDALPAGTLTITVRVGTAQTGSDVVERVDATCATRPIVVAMDVASDGGRAGLRGAPANPCPA